jgi:hypothetical protein
VAEAVQHFAHNFASTSSPAAVAAVVVVVAVACVAVGADPVAAIVDSPTN